MEKRDELFRQFGPILLEAIVDFLLDNVNTLRQNQGMTPITKDEYLDQLLNHITEIPPYEWMNGEH
ncbi:hypothetical protein ES703_19087 [subsurface metagenome]